MAAAAAVVLGAAAAGAEAGTGSGSGSGSGTVLPQDAEAWAAGGDRVALERGGRIEVFTRDGALLRAVEGKGPELDASGRWLLAGGAVLHDVETGKQYPLPGETQAARWSPARDAVALEMKVGGRTDVFLLDLKREEPHLHRLTSRGGGAARWIGGARVRLMYEAVREDGGFGLYVRDRGGLGQEREFWAAPAEEPAPRLPAVQA